MLKNDPESKGNKNKATVSCVVASGLSMSAESEKRQILGILGQGKLVFWSVIVVWRDSSPSELARELVPSITSIEIYM